MAEIPSTPADGNFKVVLVPTIADPKAPKVSELTGAGVVDISCYLTGDGFNPSVDQASISDPRMCSRQEYEKPGRETHTLEVTYIDNTNSPDEDDSNVAADTLLRGSKHYVVLRRGVAYEDAFATGQKVTVWSVEAGIPQMVAPEANSVIRTTQKLFVTGETNTAVAVVAGP